MAPRPAILFLDTNILLDLPRPEQYRITGRQVTLVVIPEVMRELRGLARSPGRGQAGAAMQALASLERLAMRRGSATGAPVGPSGPSIRIASGLAENTARADIQLVERARAEQSKQPGALVAVVTRDCGVADLARSNRVKSILIRGTATSMQLERGIATHDTVLDIEL